MAGFRALAEQVRNPSLVAPQRRTALRKCLERFAPYGHRTTWHHLCHRVGISPYEREVDPDRLVLALTELEEARDVWLSYERRVARRRRLEKRAGVRQPTALDDWHRLTWGGCDIVPCEAPHHHPDADLAVVLRRVIDAMEAGRPRADCPVCGATDFEWRTHLPRYPVSGPVCRDCGIVAPVALLTPTALLKAQRSVVHREFAAA
ncbi:hypothetical protein ACFV3R_31205 [Streptomyces sp. NPDC059740]|uniref:hypothetical protein n=1 Tax=Streptomyces sp. NPDC059740 TaxID=3346926 RepID=UPI00365FE65F